MISGGQITPIDPKSDILAVSSANDVLGGDFLSRINMDLREAKGWSYGVNGNFSLRERAVPYLISAPVQADRTGDAIAALDAQFGGFLGAQGRHARRAGAGHRQQHQRASRAVRDVGRGAVAR